MDMDPDIANWILDFYLRQPLDERTLNSLLSSLPFPIENPNLQKLVLLKKLELDASRSPISETALQIMEQLEELEFRQGNKAVSDVMRRAYCWVAVDCTLGRVKVGHHGSYNGKYEFLQTLKRVWWERIGMMEKDAVEEGLGSELLWKWRDMMEVAVFDDSVYKNVLMKFEEVDAVGAVRDYVREEREKMGPSFLELVNEEMKTDKELQKIMGLDMVDGVAVENPAASGRIPTADPVAVAASPVDPAAIGSNQNKDMHKRRVKLRHKLLGLRHPREISSSNSTVTKIIDSDGSKGGPSCKNNSSSDSPEVNIAQALKSSSLELQAAVEDPLPDAFQVAESFLNETMQDKQPRLIGGNDGRPETLIVDAAGVVQSNVDNQNNVPKPSLMERNSSAHTYEWDDSIDGSQEDVACKAVIRVPSPLRINTSPLRIYQMNSSKARRKGRKWTPLEEDTLRAGVEKYGKGNWKVILTVYGDVLEGRREGDLKDKWRNMTRYGR